MAILKRKTHWMLPVGIGILAFAILWWFAYYGQWQGPFNLLNRKIGCLMGDAFECANFRDFIGPSPVPVYSPIAWYTGVVCVVVGLVLSRRYRV